MVTGVCVRNINDVFGYLIDGAYSIGLITVMYGKPEGIGRWMRVVQKKANRLRYGIYIVYYQSD